MLLLRLSYVSLTLTLSLGEGSAGSADPLPPVWPNAFSINFTESTLGGGDTNGTWIYDFANLRQRLDRDTGKFDRFCGSVDNADSPCTHLVRDGIRYLIWPVLKKCCGCCTDADGCGIVKPTWMIDSNGTYSGNAPLKTPVWSGNADSWEITGNQPNYWFTVAGTDTPVGFAQVPIDYQYFIPASYETDQSFPDSLFTLPKYCEPKCTGINTCTLV
jgi:hypothetical protein